jgi:N-acetylglucosamine-6-phosphate deacetylase
MSVRHFINARIASPQGWIEDGAVTVHDGRILAIEPGPSKDLTGDCIDLEGDVLAAGFFDLQVNGGGGVLLNDNPSVEAIRTIMSAHAEFGTTAMLPTLITDDLAVVKAAIEAVDEAIAQKVPGIVGIHLEGPFLNEERKGVHDSTKFKRLDQDAIDLLSSLKNGKTLVTLAPELAPPGAIAALVGRGVHVFAGHTNASYEQIQAAKAEGLSGFTHLFNAMSQLGSRAPGVVGAALTGRDTFAGLIADGVHVHPANLALAARALGVNQCCLVTDAMPTVGSPLGYFELGGQRIVAKGPACFTPDGVLAGSNLDMAQAVQLMVALSGVPLIDALAMASHSPARAMGLEAEFGALVPGMKANLVRLGRDGMCKGSWVEGV